MMIDLTALRARLQQIADNAQDNMVSFENQGDNGTARYYAGRRDGALASIAQLDYVEATAARERDAALSREPWNESTGEGVDLAAVARLEDFARSAGGAVDMASGEVHSDADGGL